MMQKGTALVGFFLSFILGMLVMYGVNKSNNAVAVSAEPTEAVAADSASPISVGKDDPSWGKADALVTILEISDFQCPFCSRVGKTIEQIKKTYGPEKVRLVWKHNPLPFHKQARPAHAASQAAFDLGGNEAFWKFHDLAFQNQKALTPANFEKWAVASGLDAAKFKAALADKKYAAKVEKDLAANKKIGATGTPAFRINGITLSGAQPFARFKTLIDAQLKEAAALVKKGTKPKDVSVALTKKNYKEAPAKDSKKKKPKKEDTTVWKVPVFKDDPSKGAADALITIVEWSDFQCPFCSRVNPTIKKVMDEYGKDVRVVWKDNPLPFHKQAKPAAALGRAAFKKGGSELFWKAHDLMFENQKGFSAEKFAQLGVQLGLSPAAVTAEALADKAVQARISKSQELAMDLNARGTPHFFVNGRRLSGAQPFPAFKKLIDEQLKIAKALVKKGTARADVYAAIMKGAKGPPKPEKREVAAPGPNNPVKGKANAKIVIQEFSDFQCPYCSRVNPAMKQIMAKYGDQVQVVWRNMPLPFHKDAPLAGQAAQEAFSQKGSDGFWAYHDKLFANQKAIKRPDLDKYATELGLDMAKFKKALDEGTHAKHIEADVAVAKKAGVSGTPAFTINGYFLSGAQPFAKFEKLIKLALKEAK